MAGSGGAIARADPPPEPLAPAPPPLATIATVGAWGWFADPRAIDYRGLPVFGWVDDDGSVMVGDAGGRRFALQVQLERNDHDSPAFYVRRDGRLTAFWSGHRGASLEQRTTIGDDITAWGPVTQAPANPPGGRPGYTYPNPIRVGSRLYLFWSGSGSHATFAVSRDDGATWGPARRLFDPATPYVRYVKYRAAGGEIHLAWTLKHPRQGRSGVYHALIRDGALWRQDGRRLGTLGAPIASTAGDRVFPPRTDGGAWIHDIAIDHGRPVLVYATFPAIRDHVYRWARWDPSSRRWTEEPITAAGPAFTEDAREQRYSGGISLDPDDPTVAYLSRTIGGIHEIDRWMRTPDGWSSAPITRRSPVANVRPFPVAGGLAWMRGRYSGYQTFGTSLVWLPRGAATPIGRPPVPLGMRIDGPRQARPGDRLTVVATDGVSGRVELRFVPATAARGGRIVVAARRSLVLRGDRAVAAVPRLPAGRYRVSAWSQQRRLAWRPLDVR